MHSLSFSYKLFKTDEEIPMIPIFLSFAAYLVAGETIHRDPILSTLLAFVVRCLGHVATGGLGSGRGQACLSRGGFLLLHCPIEGEVILVVEGAEQDPEELSEVEIVGLFLETETSGVIQIHGKLR